jgi:hypothetical protein
MKVRALYSVGDWVDIKNSLKLCSIGGEGMHHARISLFLPYKRNTDQVRMPAPVGSGGLG